MKGCGFPVVVVPIRNKVRTNLTITDRHGLTVKLNEPGPGLEKAEVTKIEKTVRAYLDKTTLADALRQSAAGFPRTSTPA